MSCGRIERRWIARFVVEDGQVYDSPLNSSRRTSPLPVHRKGIDS